MSVAHQVMVCLLSVGIGVLVYRFALWFFVERRNKREGNKEPRRVCSACGGDAGSVAYDGRVNVALSAFYRAEDECGALKEENRRLLEQNRDLQAQIPADYRHVQFPSR